MSFIKCPKCGREEPSFDYAHICGPLKVKPRTNERIRELALQCWENRPSGQLHFDNEKYAELIIQECSNWLKQPVNQTPLCGVTMNIAADRLKEHFGVE
jgi:hypothetical protein